MGPDGFLDRYSPDLLSAFYKVADTALDLFDSPPVDPVEARCVLHALDYRCELAEWMTAGGVEAIARVERISDRIRTLGAQYGREDDGSYPPAEMAVVASLAERTDRLDEPWGRLAAEGSLLRLASALAPHAGRSRAHEQAVALLRDLRDFILDAYQSVPPARLKGTLRELAVLLDLR